MKLPAPTVLGLVVALAVGGLVVFAWPRAEPTVKEAVERRIVELTRAAEQRDLGDLADGLSEDFRSSRGWRKQEAKAFLAAQVLRGQWLRVFTVDIEVAELSPAAARFEAKFIFGRSEAPAFKDLARESVMSAYRVAGTFMKEADGTWRITEADHQALDSSQLF